MARQYAPKFGSVETSLLRANLDQTAPTRTETVPGRKFHNMELIWNNMELPIIPGPSKRNIFLLITLFLLILPIERNFRNLRGNCKFHVPHPCCGKSCKFGHQKCAEIGGKCAEIGGKCAEIGGKCAEIGGKPKTNLF